MVRPHFPESPVDEFEEAPIDPDDIEWEFEDRFCLAEQHEEER